MIWYVFPTDVNVSWEGHLSGLITGLLFALFFKKEIAKPKKYVWEQEDYNADNDPFLKHFDENGNFIEIDKTEIEQEPPTINYTYKENLEDES